MLSFKLIQRCHDKRDYERLARLLTPGDGAAAASLPLRARLAHRAAATGIALRRVVELSYGPSDLSRSLVGMLVHLQRPDGSFDGASERDPIATAAAAAGLAAVLAEPLFQAGPLVEVAHDRAVAALASMQDGQGLFSGPDDRTWQDRALASAYVLMMLAGDDRFRATVRLADAMTWFDENEPRLERPTADLFRLARATRPAGAAELKRIAALAA